MILTLTIRINLYHCIQTAFQFKYYIRMFQLDPCIGCYAVRADVRLVKGCEAREAGERQCRECYCRPLWCASCLGRVFAGKQVWYTVFGTGTHYEILGSGSPRNLVEWPGRLSNVPRYILYTRCQVFDWTERRKWRLKVEFRVIVNLWS